jgi:hypothetical protein
MALSRREEDFNRGCTDKGGIGLSQIKVLFALPRVD